MNRINENTPKVSIVTANKNGARYMEETISSVLLQDYKNIEFIIVDGVSTDGSLKILEKYKDRIKWVSEKDNSAQEAFSKAASMATGKYIMVMCISDKYLSMNWVSNCVSVLENDPEVSLVWGIAADMSEEGSLVSVWQPWLLGWRPPQKKRFIDFWIAMNAYLPELNYCIRKDVFDKCYPYSVQEQSISGESFLSMNYNFHVQGYLPYFLPVIAHCGRKHPDQLSVKLKDILNKDFKDYKHKISRYAFDILIGRRKHVFRDSSSQKIADLRIADKIRIMLNYFLLKAVGIIIRAIRIERIIKVPKSKK